MKILSALIIFFIGISLNAANSKSLKSFYGNSLNNFKGNLRKPLASPLENDFQDNYKRAKREVLTGIKNFQEFINTAKAECVREMKMDPSTIDKSLMSEENPTDGEKCLMMCMLKKTKLMEDTNKLSENTVGRIAAMISENNPLVVSIAVATCSKCNAQLRPDHPCDVAHQISKCIGSELKSHKLKLYY